ncbi:uncharacterized protein HMPREF1541_06804 [Cyphellophora europaea CBS 101466]|uniref:Zn(2)-C6 fungal-type domain-containing protein n=1 Tax=Cyphellophora europaea (strain CBS 101466) TaxID=1220924 RepID=W2RQG5_CYPE1|nr:uncharacterized protein HMPREF1541_06804 [Cyphellophora europaea CBS 101466]ETN38766.1 hypothetical protein HMPREF1541_06804 [Cyphellophora europaea CBS 101466]
MATSNVLAMTIGAKEQQRSLQNVFRVKDGRRKHSSRPGSLAAEELSQVTSASAVGQPRGRRAHRKSRWGCKTCKSRRLKCDESKDHDGGCLKCKVRGVRCDYLSSMASMKDYERLSGNPQQEKSSYEKPKSIILDDSRERQSSVVAFSSTGAMRPISLIRRTSPLSCSRSWTPQLPFESLQVDGIPSSLAVLHHFVNMTAMTCGNSKSQIIARTEVVSSALQTPYLMHTVLGLAAAHLRSLMTFEMQPLSAKLKVAECYHWAKAIKGFRRELGGISADDGRVTNRHGHVTKHNMDQLLSTVMFISMHQFSQKDDSDLAEGGVSAPCSFVWLEDQSAREVALKWLGIQAGFKGLLQAMEPWLASSFWLPIFRTVDHDGAFSLRVLAAEIDDTEYTPSSKIDLIEANFLRLCNIAADSDSEQPYYISLETMLWCRRMRPISAESFTKLLTFVSRITPSFQQLLIDLDTAALVILAHWLALMLEIGHWWIVGRCRLEVRQIVQFLYQRDVVGRPDQRVKALLHEPAVAIGVSLDDSMEAEVREASSRGCQFR